MTDTQLYLAIGLPIIAVITSLVVSLVQISGIREDVREIRSDLRETRSKVDQVDLLRADIKAFRVEMLAEMREQRTLIDTQMRIHIAEYHK